MLTLAIVLTVLAVLIVGGLISMLAVTFPIANKVYKNHLVRTSKDVWGSHECSAPDNEEQVAMWNEGIAWADGVKDKIKPVHIVNEGLNLYGEYFDFGNRKCVIILPGRCECLKYSYFYAKPYQELGYNVLVIDTRCHGNSDGKYSSIGKHEHKDVIAWSNMLISEYGINEICLHCICIGSASGILACTAKNSPKEIKSIVVEGCFATFRDSFKEHMIALNRPVFPVLDEIMILLYFKTGLNVYRHSPEANVKKLKQNILFLHSEKDIFSKPEKAQKLFDKCGSENKKLVWFAKGGHSHIRINNHQAYDDAIIEFLQNK